MVKLDLSCCVKATHTLVKRVVYNAQNILRVRYWFLYHHISLQISTRTRGGSSQ